MGSQPRKRPEPWKVSHMHLRRSRTGFVCIFNRSPSQVKRGFGPIVVCGRLRLCNAKRKHASHLPL